VLAERKVQGPGFEKTEMTLKLEKPGTLSPVEYDRMVADLVNYMVFMGEPCAMTARPSACSCCCSSG
jgi:ubiquinol-cytochrome c reductase cytochrome c1 subunit